jgi:anti-sigma factor RsiW
MSAEPLPDDGQAVSPLDCEHAVRRLWDYLDGRLPDLAREEVEAHLATCELCAPRFAFARKMQRALKESVERDQPVEPAAEAEASLRSRVRAALRRQSVSRGSGDADGDRDAVSD